MTKSTALAIPVVLLALFMAYPLTAVAQSCGTNCQACGYNGWSMEATTSDPDGDYSMTCPDSVLVWCEACGGGGGGGPEEPGGSVADFGPAAREIVEALVLASPTELQSVLKKYRNRLLMHEARRLLIVQGSKCDAQSFESVVFLSPDETEVLRRFGVRSLQRFLAAKQRTE